MGRKAHEIPKVRVNVRIDPEIYPQLELKAKKEGRTVANLLAQLGAEAVQQEQKAS